MYCPPNPIWHTRLPAKKRWHPVVGFPFWSKFLNQYAETGEKYVDVLQKIIEQNNLKDFDDARLLPSSIKLESLI